VSSFSCPYEVDERCEKVRGAYCRPGMKGCVLAGKVEFPDGCIPAPVWPRGSRPRRDEPNGGNDTS
jgi:hypothetical protein